MTREQVEAWWRNRPSWNEPARARADQLTTAYRASGEERGRLHDLSFDGAPDEAKRAGDALDLLNTPTDALHGILSRRPGAITRELRREFTDLLARSELKDAAPLVAWLRSRSVDCPRVADLIERADLLRVDVLAALTAAERGAA